MMDKLFDGSDAHLLGVNAELIERLNEPELYYPGNFDTVKRANALLSGLCQEAADALDAADKRIAELERDITDCCADYQSCGKELYETGCKLDVAREALSAMLTHMGMDEDEWNKPTFDQAREALAQIGGNE